MVFADCRRHFGLNITQVSLKSAQINPNITQVSLKQIRVAVRTGHKLRITGYFASPTHWAHRHAASCPIHVGPTWKKKPWLWMRKYWLNHSCICSIYISLTHQGSIMEESDLACEQTPGKNTKKFSKHETEEWTKWSEQDRGACRLFLMYRPINPLLCLYQISQWGY